MALPAYSKYRLYITKNSSSSGTIEYVTIAKFSGHESVDGLSADLLVGTASASSTFSGWPASNAFDNDPGTSWSSAESVSGVEWLRIDLASAVQIRTFKIASTNASNSYYAPKNFIVQGSNDGTNWDNLAEIVDWVPTLTTSHQGSVFHGISLRGVSVLDSGDASTKVFLHNYSTGAFVKEVIPAPSTGAWSVSLQETTDILVTHIGPSGYRPISDGPITPIWE